MTLPPTIVTDKHAQYYSSREGQPIRCIVAHDTERPTDDSSSLNYLMTGGGRKVSIHVFIEESGTSYVLLSDNVAANHCGYATINIDADRYSPETQYNANTISLGFELEHTAKTNKPYPEDQLLAMGYWINIWRAKYGALPVFRHGDIDPKRRSDPVALSHTQIEQYAQKAMRLMANHPTPELPVSMSFIVPQVVYTDRRLDAPFAKAADQPFVFGRGSVVLIGDITGDWAWIATGIGFVPRSTLK